MPSYSKKTGVHAVGTVFSTDFAIPNNEYTDYTFVSWIGAGILAGYGALWQTMNSRTVGRIWCSPLKEGTTANTEIRINAILIKTI